MVASAGADNDVASLAAAADETASLAVGASSHADVPVKHAARLRWPKYLVVAALVSAALTGLVVVILFLVVSGTEPAPLPPACVNNCSVLNHSQWTSLLEKHIRQGVVGGGGVTYNAVDYAALGRDEGGVFRDYLNMVAYVDTSKLTEGGRKALFISECARKRIALPAMRSLFDPTADVADAYNAFAIRMLIDNKCSGSLCGSIRDIGTLVQSVWKKPAGTIGHHDASQPVEDFVYSLDDIEHGYLRPGRVCR